MRSLALLYTMSSVSILCFAIIYPLALGSKDFPSWSGYIVYPLAFIICVTQKECMSYFDKHHH